MVADGLQHDDAAPAIARPEVAAARRVVVKVGTRVLSHDDGRPALARLFAVVEAAARLRRRDREVLLVSSGAVGLGMRALGLASAAAPLDLQERQACAAVGQARLMGLYQEGFDRLGLQCAQVLLTQGDFEHRLRYLNLRSTLTSLLRHGVVPVINENDAVATDELAFDEGQTRPVFGDNDKLSALVAAKLDAELLVLLTDVPGVFERDPQQHPSARLLPVLDQQELVQIGAASRRGRGGMITKLEAAAVANRAACHCVIASGLDPAALPRLLDGEAVGTWCRPQRRLAARERWIAFAVTPRGRLHLDAGAVRAVCGDGASVLAAGVAACEGSFEAGDVVELVGPDGVTIGRGMAFCDAGTARAWCSGERPAGVRNHHALVHRDHLVLENER